MCVICCLMNKMYRFPLLIILVVIVATIFSSCSDNQEELSNERIKISLREVGNQLLHSNNDSTSLVLPIVEFEKLKYRILFQKKLSIKPEELVDLMHDSFEKGLLLKNYIVEVIQCADNEVAYSYETKNNIENSIIPCRGRSLDKNCYSIEVKISLNNLPISYSKYFLYFLPLLIILGLFLFRKKTKPAIIEANENFIKLGLFQFYSEQNKLIIDRKEIKLSRKECELLSIFVKSANKIVKREELMKQVWEDNGVFVGRSLDTYISKLRKILKADTSIKLVNVHGVGYRLEVK